MKRQKLVYCNSDLKAPPALVKAVRWPDPDVVACFLDEDPGLVWADHLLFLACRVPGYEGHGGLIPESDKRQEDRCRIVDLFMAHGAHPTMRNRRKVTPLHVACRFDLPEVAARLIEHGAEVNAYDEARETPIYRAVNLGYPECVRVMIEHGADLDFQNRKGSTPLHRAVMRGKKDIVPMLLASGTRTDISDKAGKFPIDYCRNKVIREYLEES